MADSISTLQRMYAAQTQRYAEAEKQLVYDAVGVKIGDLHDANLRNSDRSHAATELGILKSSRALAALVEALLHDESIEVRTCASWALGEMGDVRAVEPLMAALQDDFWRVRDGASVSLGRLGDPRAVPALVEVLFDKDGDVVGSADAALKKFGESVVPAVIAVVKAGRLGGRHAASRMYDILVRSGGAALEPLTALREDSNGEVRAFANRALESIGCNIK